MTNTDFTRLPGYDPETDVYTAPPTPTPTPRSRPAIDLSRLGGFVGSAEAAPADESPWAATQPAHKPTTPAPRGLAPVDEGDSPWAASQPPPEHAETVRRAYAAGHDAAMTRLGAAGLGFQDLFSLNWRDEIAALARTSDMPEWLGGWRGFSRLMGSFMPASVVGERAAHAREDPAYLEELARQRALSQQAFEEHPGYYRAGEAGGLGAGAIAYPAIRAGALLTRAAPWVQRAVTAGTTGGFYGGISGAGGAETEGDRGPAGLEGAGLGALVGGVASPAVDTAAAAARWAAQSGRNWYQGLRTLFDPQFIEQEAARRIAGARARDTEMRGGAPALTPTEENIAARAHLPITNVELGAGQGGQHTTALARSAANVSPEARTALTDLARTRFQGQSNRTANFISSLFGNAPEASTEILALEDAARRANAPMYRSAYAAGDFPLRSPELDRLMGADAIKKAMRSAVSTSKDRAIAERHGAFNPGVTVTPDGRIIFDRGRGGVPTYPNLQYWDSVHRDLSDMVARALEHEPSKGQLLTTLHQQLTAELDNLVPRFAAARAGHAANMGARSALELGHDLVLAKNDNADIRRALAPMSDAERELVARGFGSELINRIREIPDNRDVINQSFFSSLAARERIAMALNTSRNPQRAQQIEAYLRLESIADQLRNALGNSTTTRQLIESGMASPTGHGIGIGILGGMMGEHVGAGHLLNFAAFLAASYMGRQASAAQVGIARRIGEMLASDNPIQASRAARMAASNPRFMATLRAIHNELPNLIARAAGASVGPAPDDNRHR
jgi:hypothetical protein